MVGVFRVLVGGTKVSQKGGWQLLEASPPEGPCLEGWQGALGAGWEWGQQEPGVDVIQQTLGLTGSKLVGATAQLSLVR